MRGFFWCRREVRFSGEHAGVASRSRSGDVIAAGDGDTFPRIAAGSECILLDEILLNTVLELSADAPFYRPVMPGNGKPFSVEQTNFGPLGWVSDKAGYRYQPTHPVTGKPWPDIPRSLLDLWDAIAAAALLRNVVWSIFIAPMPAWACIRIATRRRMRRWCRCRWATAPAFASAARRGAGRPEASFCASGDVLMFGGEARRAYHGIDRILPGTSTLVPGAGGST